MLHNVEVVEPHFKGVNMSDLDNDLDFSELGTKKIEKKKKTKFEKKMKRKSSGVVLTVSTKEPGVYAHVDLALCTPDEFIEWAKGVYPVDLTPYKEKLNNLNMRVNTFNSILHYHTTSLFYTGKQEVSNTTVH
jgi:hypothetical protein